MAQQKVALVTGAGTGIGRATRARLDGGGLRRRARRPAQGHARRDREARRRDRRQDACGADRHERPGQIAALFAKTMDDLWPARPACSTMPASARRRCRSRMSSVEQWKARRRHQPHRTVPVHAARVPHHEGPDAARRPHHQQRLDLGACAAAAVGGLHRDQARDHRIDEVDLARRPRLRHRLRPDRHRQCGNADDRADDARRAAAERRIRRRAAHGRAEPSPTRWSTWRACRSTPTCCS